MSDNALTTGHAPNVVPHAEEAHHQAPTEWRKLAMWLFLASEVMFFTVLIAGVIFARFKYPDDHNVLNIPLTSVNTFLLLMSSFTVVRSLAAIQSGDRTKFLRSMLLTVILGSTFLGVQATEYSNLAKEGLTLSSGLYGMAFFTLTGFHGAHVLIGVIWGLYTFLRGFDGKYTQKDHFAVEFFGLYWHFVDVVWILIFTLVYLI